MTEKTVLILGDIHSGSRYATVHPKATIQDEEDEDDKGQPVTMKKAQKSLWECWKYLVQEYKNPDIMVVNGDCFDGPQFKGSGRSVWSTNMYDQIKNCQLLLEMFNAKKIYFTLGSAYHVSLNNKAIECEEVLGDLMGTQKIRGKHAPKELWLDIDGVIFNFAHRISTTKVPHYRSTFITREMFVTSINKKHLHDADVIVRSHSHYFWHVESEQHHGFVTPPMQLRNDFVIEFMGNGGVSALGAIRLRVVDGKFTYEANKDKILFDNVNFKPPLVKA